jgi:predicted DNA-binding antitoxin AbrB/MazE fold protein
MAIIVEATYEDGVLKPSQPLPLKEHEKVRVILERGTSPLLDAYGIVQWNGEPATLEQFATDAELAFPPPGDEP